MRTLAYSSEHIEIWAKSHKDMPGVTIFSVYVGSRELFAQFEDMNEAIDYAIAYAEEAYGITR